MFISSRLLLRRADKTSGRDDGELNKVYVQHIYRGVTISALGPTETRRAELSSLTHRSAFRLRPLTHTHVGTPTRGRLSHRTADRDAPQGFFYLHRAQLKCPIRSAAGLPSRLLQWGSPRDASGHQT
uniref:Uncharacterized protein n=1 Tax=Rhipicephalus microplus TaxID=6941 RepID=A0A6G5AJ74_RHIMP